jgi:ribulose-bisphosphate carboxylase small chain
MTNDIRGYTATFGAASSKRFGTFSYLPPLSDEEVRRQVEHFIDRGWNCAIEHVESTRTQVRYWYMWKLPMFGVRDQRAILAEVADCRRSNPGHHVRLVAYDSKRQTLGMSFVVAYARDARDA